MKPKRTLVLHSLSLDATPCHPRETRSDSATLGASRQLSIIIIMSEPKTSNGSCRTSDLPSSAPSCRFLFFFRLLPGLLVTSPPESTTSPSQNKAVKSAVASASIPLCNSSIRVIRKELERKKEKGGFGEVFAE